MPPPCDRGGWQPAEVELWPLSCRCAGTTGQLIKAASAAVELSSPLSCHALAARWHHRSSSLPLLLATRRRGWAACRLGAVARQRQRRRAVRDSAVLSSTPARLPACSLPLAPSARAAVVRLARTPPSPQRSLSESLALLVQPMRIAAQVFSRRVGSLLRSRATCRAAAQGRGECAACRSACCIGAPRSSCRGRGRFKLEAGWSKCEVIARLWRRCEFAAAFRSMS